MPRSTTLVLAMVTLAALLTACAANDPKRLADAATAPLNDLNLVRADIPAVLAAAEKQPYAMPANATCEALHDEVRELDAALGPDLDTPSSDANPSLIERGTNEAKTAAIGTVRRTTESIVPFRGWIRKLTGAERYSKNVASAITAGTIRRSFVKGIRAAKECA